MIYPIIIAGGSGSRLWPLSRELYPKQFLTLTNNSSMLQQTFSRLSRLSHYPPMVICNEEHRFITAEQIRTGGFSHSGIILEPFARNTAPAIALAAMQSLIETDDDPLLLILAADHLVEDVEAFSRSIESAIDYAQEGQLVTFGIIPQSPETGYGYIKRGQKELGNNGGFKVEKFVEKPDSVTAQAYLDTGDYYWNSGMFMFKASSYLEELKKFSPDIYFSCRKSLDESNKDSDLDFVRLDKDEFKKCPSDSIDYAVMEKTSKATVVSMNAGWSDIGSWSALWDISDKDDCNNVSKGDVIAHKSTGNYLHSEGRLIATVCVDDLIVVDTKDAILVASRHHVQDVKGIVEELKLQGRNESKVHREVYRPWGKYDSIDFGDRDNVKRITVNPGEKLSLQMHHHRAEHWVVVSGIAKVVNGEQTLLISEDQSTYIPVGTIHSLENPGVIPLEMIEVQTGGYLGEDDIVRFEDCIY